MYMYIQWSCSYFAIKVAYRYKLCFNKYLLIPPWNAVQSIDLQRRGLKNSEVREGTIVSCGPFSFLLFDNVLVFFYIKLCFIIENGKQRLKNAHFQVGFFRELLSSQAQKL